MTESFPKLVPIRLEPSDYGELRRRVMRRDGWRCQFCGSRQNLQVHHQQYRSHSGEDTEANLITLCEKCHSLAHGIAEAHRCRTD